ncbi:MAG: bifunctional metallophosphatase/5'-nucleotidase, partial [Actinomycetales bacterium]|nr:bifunctional metallophosphatase/5'-nucleotidase [Actinomycetales bacterium]
MQKGGCHPVEGPAPDAPYTGAKFHRLAANVIRKDNGRGRLPATSIKEVNGEKIGFHRDDPQGHANARVSPAGVATVDAQDEVETANRQAVRLRKEGVKAIVVLIHEGGYQTGEFGQCLGISEPIYGIASKMSPEIDMI